MKPLNKHRLLNISIAEQKRVDDVIKPYKMIASRENKMTGSMSPFDLERVVNVMKNWEISDLTLENNNLSEVDLNELIHAPNRFTLFFPDDVPFPVYDIILPFSITNIPEDEFDRLIVNWNRTDNDELKIYFASSKSKTLYSAIAGNVNMNVSEAKSRFTDS